jgi:hypothetical protein
MAMEPPIWRKAKEENQIKRVIRYQNYDKI